MRFLSLFSGIEAASVAWLPLGWEAVGLAEIDPFCCAVLSVRFPAIPNFGDVTQLSLTTLPTLHPDLTIFGWPCQDVSVAGQRKGLLHEGEKTRSGLFYDAVAAVRASGSRWFVGENVPGLLSSKRGQDFADVLAELTGLRFEPPHEGWRSSGIVATDDPEQYSVAWRMLDAQYFGVPQRRRRIFLVGYRGDWRPPAAVLFERHSLQGDFAPSRQARESVAACLTQGVDSQGKGGYAGRRREDDVNLVAYAFGSHASAADAEVSNKSHANGGATGLNISEETAYSLRSARTQAICFDTTQITSKANRSNPKPDAACHPLTNQGHAPLVIAQNGSDIQISDIPGTVSASYAKQTSGDVLVYSTSGQGYWREGNSLRARANESHEHLVVEQETTAATQRSGGAGGAPSSRGEHLVLALTERTRADGRNLESQENLAYCLTNPGSGGRPHSKLIQDVTTQVRRLTPLECERLQGFPDDWTLVPYHGKLAKDGPRYRAIGNSMAVPVVRWIGERIAAVQNILDQG